MIRISQLKLPCGHSEGALEEKIRKTLRMGSRNLSFSIVRHSIDARKKPRLLDIFTVDVVTGMKPAEEQSLIRRLKNKNIAVSPVTVYRFPDSGSEVLSHRPVIIGAGPAGLFCALFLSEHGYRPIVIERGSRMEERTADVLRYWETGVLNPLSNVQFGEGGAGTFSDGKLNTQINDRQAGRMRCSAFLPGTGLRNPSCMKVSPISAQTVCGRSSPASEGKSRRPADRYVSTRSAQDLSSIMRNTKRPVRPDQQTVQNSQDQTMSAG
jgi:hypothetical protein